MLSFFADLPHLLQALTATIFTWGITAAGAALVYMMYHPRKLLMDGMLGFSAGIMIAASFWPLLSLAIKMAQTLSMNAWFTVSIGFLAGGFFLFAGDLLCEKLISKNQYISLEKRCAMLMLSIAIHNIPECLAVSVAFGALAHPGDRTALISACMLALGSGLQNFPEGTAVSIPMLRDGYSRHQAFFMGQLSGLVEPLPG